MIRKLHRIWPQPKLLVGLGLLHICLAVLQGAVFACLVPILRALLRPEPDFAAATPWMIAGGVGFVVYLTLSVISTPLGFRACTELAAQLRQRLMRHAATLPLGWFTTENKALFVRTITSVSAGIAQLALSAGVPAITGTFVPLTITAMTFVVDWRLGLLFLALLPVAVLALKRSYRIAGAAAADLEDANVEVTHRAIEFGQAQPVLRAAGRGGTGSARMSDALDGHRRRYRRGLNRYLIPDLSYTGMIMIGFAVVLVFAGQFLLAGTLSVPDTIALLILAARFLEPLGAMGDNIATLSAMEHGITCIEQVMGTPALRRSPKPVQRVDSADIEFRDVTFSYDQQSGDAPALSGVTLRCSPGTTTALVGPSGSGKTTVTRLIARFFDVDSGQVLVGGVDVSDYDHPALMSEIAIVFQDVYLFDTTIEENLRLALPEATHDELVAAARAARLDDVIERLPNGWQTQVGEGGAQLSGGERQRVSIARAFLKRSRIVLIDEAASALDPENEKAIAEAIANLTRQPDRTVIVIAHRPATLATADQVVSLDAGRVTEIGIPAELFSTGGTFTRLYNQYEQAQSWRISGSIPAQR